MITLTNSRILLFLIGASLAPGCEAMSLHGVASTSPSGPSAPRDTSESHADAQSRGSGAAGDAPVDPSAFATIGDEENKKNARDFKVELRHGKLAKLFESEALFQQVEALCGTKVWDQCTVDYDGNGDELGWKHYPFKVHKTGAVYDYPSMFFEQAEPIWAQTTVERIRTSGYDHEETLVAMVKEQCGDPIDTGCVVRAYGSSRDYQLVVRDSGEVIEVMRTLDDWLADL